MKLHYPVLSNIETLIAPKREGFLLPQTPSRRVRHGVDGLFPTASQAQRRRRWRQMRGRPSVVPAGELVEKILAHELPLWRQAKNTGDGVYPAVSLAKARELLAAVSTQSKR